MLGAGLARAKSFNANAWTQNIQIEIQTGFFLCHFAPWRLCVKSVLQICRLKRVKRNDLQCFHAARRNWGKTVNNVASSHWFSVNFGKYSGHWNDLPVDSDELISLVAPRPVFLNGGTGDQWADPHGAFLAAVAAGPTYRLLGRKDLGSTQMPQPDTALTSGDVAFRYHAGGHTDVPDWPIFLQFAQRYLKKPGGQTIRH